MATSINNLTLSDFASMVRMDDSGKFATSINKTSGVIYAGKDGKVHNVRSALSLSKGDANQNVALRQQLMNALEGSSKDMDFLARARGMLGLSKGGSAEAYKPLSRMVVKQLLQNPSVSIQREKDLASSFVVIGEKEHHEIAQGAIDELKSLDEGKESGWVSFDVAKIQSREDFRMVIPTIEEKLGLKFSAKDIMTVIPYVSAEAMLDEDNLSKRINNAKQILNGDSQGAKDATLRKIALFMCANPAVGKKELLPKAVLRLTKMLRENNIGDVFKGEGTKAEKMSRFCETVAKLYGENHDKIVFNKAPGDRPSEDNQNIFTLLHEVLLSEVPEYADSVKSMGKGDLITFAIDAMKKVPSQEDEIAEASATFTKYQNELTHNNDHFTGSADEVERKQKESDEAYAKINKHSCLQSLSNQLRIDISHRIGVDLADTQEVLDFLKAHPDCNNFIG